jgi:hypothetical protein
VKQRGVAEKRRQAIIVLEKKEGPEAGHQPDLPNDRAILAPSDQRHAREFPDQHVVGFGIDFRNGSGNEVLESLSHEEGQ